MSAASEFYGPLSATGGQHRAEPGARRARQLQPLVRLRPKPNRRASIPSSGSKAATLPRSLPPALVESCSSSARRPSGGLSPEAPLAGTPRAAERCHGVLERGARLEAWPECPIVAERVVPTITLPCAAGPPAA